MSLRAGTTQTIFIVAPLGATGGAELLHQLADALVRAGRDARVVYYPFRRGVQTPKPYEKYRIVQASVEEVEPGSIVVLPEIGTPLIHRFKGRDVYLWWLSVDNYHGSGKLRFLARNLHWPWEYVDVRRGRFPKAVKSHLVQSEYARRFLTSHGIDGVGWLSDYVNPAFTANVNGATRGPKRDIIAYNPAKGREMTERLMRVLGPDRFVALVGMTRDQVVETLSSAKVYIDFGNHPGKDRIPREAAALGCCVITNRRGSAANPVDMPIDDIYKIDDSDPAFAEEAGAQIEAIFADYGTHAARFDSYRDFIAGEQAAFERDTAKVFVDAGFTAGP